MRKARMSEHRPRLPSLCHAADLSVCLGLLPADSALAAVWAGRPHR